MPNIYNINFPHLFLDIENSSTIISLAAIYMNVPADIEKNVAVISSLKFDKYHPKIIPNGLVIENIKIILIAIF